MNGTSSTIPQHATRLTGDSRLFAIQSLSPQVIVLDLSEWRNWTDEMTTVGERVKQRRAELGWTQCVLAEKAGISKSFLSDLENCRRSIGAETLLDLGRAMGVSLDFLMTGEDSAAHEDSKIPESLARLAEESGLSVRNTLTLLRIREQIIESRRGPKKGGNVDWRELYLALKKFL